MFMMDNLADDGVANEWGCIPTKGLGLGFSVIARPIIENLAARAPKLRFPGVDEPIPHLFRCDSIGDLFRGEDVAFFSDIRALGHKVWLDPSITLSHIGSKAYTASVLDHLIKEPLAA